jgi:hypothetical protein
MKNRINDILKFGLTLLLLASLFRMPYEFYEIQRFILMATFAWFVISEYVPNKFGWSFLYGILALLFNPFLKLKIEASGWKIIDLATAAVLIFNLIEGYGVSYLKDKIRSIQFEKHYKKIISNKNIILIKRICIAIFVIIVSYYLFKYIENKQNIRKEETEKKIQQHFQDSIKQVNKTADSIWAIENRIKKEKQILLFCNEKGAVSNFKDYLHFYHPQWKLKKINDIYNSSDCVFKISCLGYVPDKMFMGTETIIAEVDLNPDGDFKTYQVRIISGTFYDD